MVLLLASISISSSSSMASSSSCVSKAKPKSSNCKHSPSATLDVLILIVVLFSVAFLLSSYFSYIFNSLSLLLSQSHSHSHFPIPSFLGFFLFFAAYLIALDLRRSRKCHAPGCKGLKKAMEFDLQLQTEDILRSGCGCEEIDRLPWKGGREGNPDYESLTSELRKMAPTNGRAVLLFRASCGCPIAKLEGWGPKKGKRHKKSLNNTTLTGRGDHR